MLNLLKTKIQGTVTTKIEELLKDGTDEEVLFNFSKFLGRVGVNTRFLSLDEADPVALTHQVMYIHAGGAVLQSIPQPLEYPVHPVPTPEGETVS